MYLMKAKKQFSEKDAKELEEKQEKYILRTQNRQSGRQAKDSNDEGDDVKNKEELLQPDDLPDGAHLRPRNVLAAANLDIDDQAVIKPAQYIGSFPVVGCDQSDRARYVISQLENMRNVSKTKNVLLVISLSGIKVCSQSGDSVYMAHALKRISYATCDPEHSQFSFLARDPKGCIDVQFCHAFVTQKQEEAEELNAIIGNAFKMAYAKERDKQPTFHELIQLQLEDQKVKYQEYEQEAKRVFQQKLTEIATPTPFSDKALQRMEMRRQSSSNDDMPPETPEREFTVGKNKLWAKYNVEKVQHRSPVAEIASVSPIRHSTSSAMSSDSAENNREIDEALRRNSTPVSVSSVSTLDRNTNNRAVNPLSVQAIKESFVFNSNTNKLKGSPVTALKDEIDKRLSYIPNSARLDDYDPANRSSRSGRGSVSSISSDVSNSSDTQRKLEDEKDKFSKMQNRPLPAVPTDRDGQGSPRTYSSQHSWSSCSTDSLTQPDSPVPSVFVPLRSSGNPESPRKKSNRPLSGFMQTDVIRCSLFQDPAKHSQSNGNEHSSSSSSPIIPREALSDNQIADTQSNITTSPNISQNTSQEGSAYIYGPPRKSIDNQMKGPQRSESSPSCEQVLRYQNDSPFHYQSPSMDVEENQYENKLGLESLMCLDRSHIEDESLRHSPWYQAGIPRGIALEILQQEEVGSFIIRDSSTHPGCYALSVRVPKFENISGISHYLILKTQRGVKLKGLDKEWPNLVSLVTHHTVMPEMLPCTLRLPRNSNNPSFKDNDKDEKDEDPDYQKLSDFSIMMSHLKK